MAINRSPASELLLYCIQHSLGSASLEQVQCSAKALSEHTAFLALIEKHRMWNTVLPILTSLEEGLLLNEIIQQLKAKIVLLSGIQLAQQNHLKQLIVAFNHQEIDVLLFKGLAVERWLYGTQGRSAIDIDLMVSITQVSKAVEVATTLGFVVNPKQAKWLSRPELEQQFHLSFTGIEMTHSITAIQLELQWRLSRHPASFSASFDELNQKSINATINTCEVALPSAEMHIVYLCYHGSKHYWRRLHWLLDIALVMQRDDINWDRVQQEASYLGVEPALQLAILFAATEFKITIPLFLAKETEFERSGQKLLAVMTSEYAESNQQGANYGSLKGLLAHLNWNCTLQTRRAYKVKEWAYLFFVPRQGDWQSLHLPPILAGLYYLWRPVRLLGRWVHQVFTR